MCFSRDLAYMWRRNRDLFPVIASLHLKSNVCEPGPPNDFCDVQCRRRSRINTDRGHAPPGHFLHFNPPNSPFLGFWLIQTVFFTDCPNHFPDFNLESFKFLTKNTFIMKNLTDWHKTVETGMDLYLECFVCHRNHLVAWVAADITFGVERRDNRKYICVCGLPEVWLSAKRICNMIFNFQSPD